MEITSSLFNLLFSLSIILIFYYTIYLVIKRAVKKGILEAHDELKKKEETADTTQTSQI